MTRWRSVLLTVAATVSLIAPAEATRAASPSPKQLEQFLFSKPAGLARSSEFLREAVAIPEKTRGDQSALYRKVAPATVVVRTQNGYGSGVVISADGYILTNHHVAVDGEEEDFTVKLGVERGSIGPDGVMQRLPGTLWARVVRWDADSDVALLKLDAAPKDLSFAPLAPRGPAPGEEAFALGHGNIGLLWSFRACNVTGVGERSDRAMQVVSPLRAEEEKTVPAGPKVRVVQSSCVITPGDSGGPLFNTQGQVVALNDYYSTAPGTPQTASFHVDWKHLEPIVAVAGPAPMRVGPDPWMDALRGVFGDLDGDGAVDSLRLFTGANLMSSTVFFDVRQRTASGADPDEFVQEKRFPFDLAVTARGSRLFVHAPGRLFEVDREGQVLAAFERNDTTGELISLPAKLRPSSMLEVAAVLPDAERVRLVQALAKTYPSLVGDNGGGASPIHNSHSSRSWMGETETVTVPSTSSCTRRCSAER